MLKYPEARQTFIEALRRDVDAHEAGRYDAVGAGFEDIDAALPVTRLPNSISFRCFELLGRWIDSRNHNWLYYEGITQRDWPVLARHIIKSLEADDEFREPTVLSQFDLRARVYSKGPIKRLFERLWK